MKHSEGLRRTCSLGALLLPAGRSQPLQIELYSSKQQGHEVLMHFGEHSLVPPRFLRISVVPGTLKLACNILRLQALIPGRKPVYAPCESVRRIEMRARHQTVLAKGLPGSRGIHASAAF